MVKYSVAGAPVGIGLRARSSNPVAVVEDESVDLLATLLGATVFRPFSIPEAEWSFAAAVGGILNSAVAVTIKAAAGAGLRNYITSLEISSEALGVATEVVIRDGAAGSVLWRTKIGIAGLIGGRAIVMASPIKSSVNTLLEVVTLTASVTGAVYLNAQGYVAP